MSERSHILRRRRGLVTAALSGATLSAATVRAQVCLSVAPPEPISCSSNESSLGGAAAVEALLEVARCYAEEEGDLVQARRVYRLYLERTASMPRTAELVGARNRARWTIERIDALLAANEGARPMRCEDTDPPSEQGPPGYIEVVTEPEVAPRSGGAASCGCEVGGQENPAAAVVLAAAAIARRRRIRRRR